jgi:hypothetical protein
VSEVVGVMLLLVGLILVLWALGWLTVLSWRARGLLFALLVIFFTPVAQIAYGLIHFRTARRPIVLLLAGMCVGAVPFAYSHGFELIFGLGERERIIDGERHLVLTGWDRPDYSILQIRSDTVVLELANANVTDATLELLLPFKRLKELTLNDSAVTDAGLNTLRQLPALQRLRLARTKITAEGLKDFLAAAPKELNEIDVSGNSIPTSILRKWKNLDSEHRRYVN